MINYEEELKKFEPCLDVTDAESAICSFDVGIERFVHAWNA